VAVAAPWLSSWFSTGVLLLYRKDGLQSLLAAACLGPPTAVRESAPELVSPWATTPAGCVRSSWRVYMRLHGSAPPHL